MEHRPAEELYDLRNDRDHLENLADDPKCQEALQSFRSRISELMNKTSDPRLEDRFDFLPWSDPGLASPR
jgi:hypothetical protein